MIMSARSAHILLLALAVGSPLLCIGLNLYAVIDIAAVSRLQADTDHLAAELRQSSDDITRFIRTYTVTGNTSYIDYFNHVISIRAGQEQYPDPPWRIYWDMYVAENRTQLTFAGPRSLLDRMKDAGFTQEEFALLAEATRRSNELIDLETVAYNAMNGRYRPVDGSNKNFSIVAPANQTWAMQLVHGVAYHQYKGGIMSKIDEFMTMANARVAARQSFTVSLNVASACVLAVTLLLLVGLMLFYFLRVEKDTQSKELFSVLLPERVCESISLTQIADLRAVARKRMKKLRGFTSDKGGSRPVLLGTREAFPTLYSEHLPAAWVAFTDVVSFTTMCLSVNSEVVVSVLNELMSLFDVTAEQFGVSKIKTIGDAYMCAKITLGENDRETIREAWQKENPMEWQQLKRDECDHLCDESDLYDLQQQLHHPVDQRCREKIIEDGNDMVRFLTQALRAVTSIPRPDQQRQRRSTLRPPDLMSDGNGSNDCRTLSRSLSVDPESFSESDIAERADGGAVGGGASYHKLSHIEMRAGLHIGSIASGIVGYERPLYDLFGETVNCAARLESTGKANYIHVLQSTADLLETPTTTTTQQQLDLSQSSKLRRKRMAETHLKGIGTVPTVLIMGAKDSPLDRNVTSLRTTVYTE